MNKSELITAVAAKTGMTQKQTAPVVDSILGAISDALANGDKVQLVGFGTFEVRSRSARTARNPRTGEEIKVAASKAPAFKAGKALKESVNTKPAKKKK